MESNRNFESRREHLLHLSDVQLKENFWRLADEVVQPLIDLARTHTSPSIERSVLLRMGFSSLEAKAIVTHCIDNGFLGKGAGHAVYRLAQLSSASYRNAGLRLAQGEGWEILRQSWGRQLDDAQEQ